MPSSAHMYDVAVVAAGPAGTAAAVGAAQAGARTALFESFGCLGGAANHEERHHLLRPVYRGGTLAAGGVRRRGANY